MLDNSVVLVAYARHFVVPGCARLLRTSGATVICHDEMFSDGESRNTFESEFPRIFALTAQYPEDDVAAALDAHGRIDAPIRNDAYPAIRAPVDEADPDEMRRAMEALVVCPYRLVSAAVPSIKLTGGGKVILATSAAPIRGIANYSMFATGRGAENAMVKSIFLELASSNYADLRDCAELR